MYEKRGACGRNSKVIRSRSCAFPTGSRCSTLGHLWAALKRLGPALILLFGCGGGKGLQVQIYSSQSVSYSNISSSPHAPRAQLRNAVINNKKNFSKTPCTVAKAATSAVMASPLAPVPLLPSSDRSAGQRNQASHSTVLARPLCLFVCVGAASLPCARPLLPSSARSAGQRNQPSHSTVLARPVCPFVCVSAASFAVFGFGSHLPPRLRILHTRTTIFSRCICRCSRMRARLPLHILLLHTQVSR